MQSKCIIQFPNDKPNEIPIQIWTFGPMPWTKKVKPGQKINLGFNGKFEPDGEAPQTVTKSFVGKQ